MYQPIVGTQGSERDARIVQPAIETWRLRVLMLIASGVVASAQVGKAIISLPLIREDLAFGLDVAGLIVAIFATLGAAMGIGAGVVVGQIGRAHV
jgi:hypothetical protein